MRVGREAPSCEADAVSDVARVVFVPLGGAWRLRTLRFCGGWPESRMMDWVGETSKTFRWDRRCEGGVVVS
jgi:hypothetical protein